MQTFNPPPILHNTKWSPLWAETNMYVSIVFMADGCSGSQEDIYIIKVGLLLSLFTVHTTHLAQFIVIILPHCTLL